MDTDQTDSQYSTGLARPSIERALIAAGKDLDRLQPADLSVVEDFHTSGRIATGQLAALAGIGPHDRVLDAGSGIGGTARYLADHFGCAVTAVDLTSEYCETNRWLNRLVGLDGRITVGQGDVTDLAFPDGSFDVVISQHVQMNVADKDRLYRQARRVLAAGGRLAVWDITAGVRQALAYPLPWADRPELSHLTSPGRLRAIIEGNGFAVAHWNDLTEAAADLMDTFLSAAPEPLGLHTFIPDFNQKARNLTDGLAGGRLRAIQGLAVTRG